MKPVAYGIDFGTTNSAVSVAWDDGSAEVVPVGESGSPVVPSILYLDATGNRSVGELAVRTHLVSGAKQGRLMSSIKSWLTDEKFTSTQAPNGRMLKMEDLVAGILGHLKQAADRHTGDRCTRVVLGRPVVFAGAIGDRFEQQTELAKRRLVEAARKAGFEEVALLDESTAALQGEDVADGVVVAADFGGGTFDVSVVEAKPEYWEVLSTHGVAVGGEFFDGLVFDTCASPALGLNREYPYFGKSLPVPYSISRMRTMEGTLRMMSEDSTAATLERWRDRLPVVNDIVFGGHAYAFYRAVEGTKIELSSESSASLSFNRPGIAVHSPMTRERLDELMRPAMKKIGSTIDYALDSAEVAPTEVTRVVRTGGSSAIPSFVQLLEDRFGADRVQERDAFATVALGLAIHAYSLWG